MGNVFIQKLKNNYYVYIHSMSLSQLWNFDISIYTDMNIPSCIVTWVFWIMMKNISSVAVTDH